MNLGVNEHHHSEILNYLRFARYQRGQRLRSVDGCFKDLKDSRLEAEETYTTDEVEEMLDGLLAVVRSEVESELLNSSHTNILLLRQLFQQAEKWHLKQSADISELENRELLRQIAEFEEQEFMGAKRDTEFNPLRLQPLNESGSTQLLQMEIQRLQDENARLKEYMRLAESSALGIAKEKTKLSKDLEKLRRELGLLDMDAGDEDPEELRKRLEKLKLQMEKDAASGKAGAAALGEDLTDTKHELLKIKAMLEMAEKELEKKVSQTKPFQNLKRMLATKNDQLKDVRRRLMKYEELDD